MARRQISAKDVEAAFENHHTTYPGKDKKNDTVVLVGTGTNQRPLCVVVSKRRRRVVVTAYWREAES
jgi:hypothetical protein